MIVSEPELEPEAVEEITDAAVAIAETEAAASIAIAEIHAETERQRIEAMSENEREVWELRERLASAETTIAELSQNLAEARQEAEALTVSEPLASETTLEEIAETIPSSTLNDTSEEIASTLTEAIVESDAEKTEVLNLPPALSVPKRAPLIRLV